MNAKKLLLAVSALVAASAFAQTGPLGSVTNVEGVVTATQGVTGVTVVPGTPVQNGMRFVTTSRGTVSLRLNSGCTLTVPPSHAVTVSRDMTCQQLIAAVQPAVPVAGVQGQFAPSAALVNGVVAVGGIAVAAAVLHGVTKDDAPLSGK